MKSARKVRIGNHTFCLAFADVMPPPSKEDLDRLRESIRKRRAVEVPVVVDQHNNLIEGNSRVLIAHEEGLDVVPVEVRHVESAEEARELAYELNLARRHLDQAQKREVIAAMLRQDPGASNRKIGEAAGANHETVGTVRRALESTGEIRQLDETTGKDGKARPARTKPPEAPAPPADPDEDPPAEVELLDIDGQSLPPQAVPAFAALPEVRKLLRRIDDLAREVEAMGKDLVGTHMHWQSAQSNLRAARKTLYQGLPAYVCPHCKGRKPTCAVCRGSGFVTTAQHERAKEAAR